LSDRNQDTSRSSVSFRDDFGRFDQLLKSYKAHERWRYNLLEVKSAAWSGESALDLPGGRGRLYGPVHPP
jgi:hypothetical protein